MMKTKSTFKYSQPYKIRKAIQSQCNNIKKNFLSEHKGYEYFFCLRCNNYILIQYARVDHFPISLKALYEMYIGSTLVGGVLKWEEYHRKYAKLRIICKDCEVVDRKICI